MKTPLVLFLLLQLLDLITTLTVIALGGQENNPIIAHFMTIGPIKGLIISKLLVSALAVGGAMLGRSRSIRLANLAFGGVVAWNVSVIARLVV
jgi:hypothetical protein